MAVRCCRLLHRTYRCSDAAWLLLFEAALQVGRVHTRSSLLLPP